MTIEYFNKKEIASLEPGTPVLLQSKDGDYMIGQRSHQEEFSLSFTIEFPNVQVDMSPYPRAPQSEWSGIPLITVSDGDLSDVLNSMNPALRENFNNIVHYVLSHEFLDLRYRTQLDRILQS